MFALLAIVASIAIGGLLWILPSPVKAFTLRDSLILVPVLSVIVAALGVGWRRKLAYFAVCLLGFVIFDLVTLELGIATLAADPRSYGADPVRTFVLLVAQVFVIAYPIIVLIFFVGSRPAVLWTRPIPPVPAAGDEARPEDEASQ